MELILVAREPDLARWAEDAGVDRVLIDLERRGKEDRQRDRAMFISDHTLDDVVALRSVLGRSRIEVRLDAWYEDSPTQVDEVLDAGADVVMLPMTESVEAARALVDAVGDRGEVSLLVETVGGLATLAELAAVEGVAEIHVGLSDLMISRGGRFIFEPLADGSLVEPARLLRSRGLGLGIGGVAAPGTPDLPVDADVLLGEVISLGVTMGWLGRSFRKLGRPDPEAMAAAVRSVRRAIARWQQASPEELASNHDRLRTQVDRVLREPETPGPQPAR